MKRIFSAGGIVLRLRLGSSIHNKGSWEVLITQHSGHKGWDFPKGHIEIGELAEQAATREVEEETGVKTEVLDKVGKSEYFYFEGKERVFKTVVFFLMKYMEEGEAMTAFEVSDKVWLPVDEVEEKLSFKGSKEVWRKAKKKVEQLTAGINS